MYKVKRIGIINLPGQIKVNKILFDCGKDMAKKYDLQLNQLKDTEQRDKYRIYGELINTYGYGIS